jgi:hypothetical protein
MIRRCGIWLACAIALGQAASAAEPRPFLRGYKPPQMADAENHPQVRFLSEDREWERIDIWAPKNAPPGGAPCVILIYGGGWGEKVTIGADSIRVLLDRGYVVAVPDYVLGAQQPIPLAIWDGAAAVRFLRAHAATYHIDPERIGAMGLSAGGWLAQYLAPSNSRTLCPVAGKGQPVVPVPMIEPHPAHGEQSARLAAFVTDWGAGTLADKRMRELNPTWLGPDDPPMFTCHNDAAGAPPEGAKTYADAGAIAEVAFVKTNNTHGVVGVGAMKGLTTRDKSGQEIPFGQRTLQFLDEYVRNPKRAMAPEIVPCGGPIHQPATVTLRSVHAAARIHYTTDGSTPTESSPAYRGPLTVNAGTKLQAVAIKPGLQPSAAASAAFTACALPPPVITTDAQAFTAKVGQEFAATFEAKSAGPVTWHIAGKLMTDRDRQRKDPRPEPVFRIDEKTGRLAGTPRSAGACPFIVTAIVRDGPQVLFDARRVVITIQE